MTIWQERVIDERDELSKKLNAIEAFISYHGAIS
jgi:hypothetical protein